MIEKAQAFTNSLPFIIFFLLLSLIIGTLAGQKVLYSFLLLVLASMVIVNSGKIAALGNVFQRREF
jgi:hypothetical protein